MAKKEADVYISGAVDAFLPVLSEVYGSSLVMTALYGSAAAGGWVQGVSDINILIVVDNADPVNLFELGKKARKILAKYRITPHLLSKNELLTSSDIFPVEYLELQKNMRLLQGDNLFGEIEISYKNLRHQVESMLRGSVQTLRQIILGTSGDNKLLKKILADWAGSQLSLFRALIRLTDSQSDAENVDFSGNAEDLMPELAARFGISQEPFINLLDLRKPVTPGNPLQLKDLVINLQKQYLTILDLVDSYETK